MTTFLDKAIDMANSQEPEETDPEHLPHVLEGLAQAERGEFASDEEVQAAFARFDRT